MGYDVSHHLGAPWYCNHITVVPLLPSVVYRNCKQRGICDLVFWILKRHNSPDTEENRLNLHISVRLSSWKHGCTAGENSAAFMYSTLTQQTHFHISRKPFPIFRALSHRVTISFKTHVSHFSVSVSWEESIVSSIACTNKSTILDNTAKR